MGDLAALQLDTLFARDARGRLPAPSRADGGAAPRVFLARSPDGNVWSVRADVPSTVASELTRLCASEPAPSALDASRPPGVREAARALLAPVTRESRGPAWILPPDLPADGRAREAPKDRVRDWLAAFATWPPDAPLDPGEPIAFAFVDGEPAALCHSACGTARAAEAGVETRPGFRGRGLAVEATACWARAVQHSGRVALYSTSWENLASQGVARRLGARLYAEDWHLT